MFNLKENTTPKLYQYIVINNLQDMVIENIMNDLGEQNKVCSTEFKNLAQMFRWSTTPEGSRFWSNHNDRFEDSINPFRKFKFLK